MDKAEQDPIPFVGGVLRPVVTQPYVLDAGDYTTPDLREIVRVERKSAADLLGCIGGGRQDFLDAEDSQIARLAAYHYPVLLIESDWTELAEILAQRQAAWHRRDPDKRVLTLPHVQGALKKIHYWYGVNVQMFPSKAPKGFSFDRDRSAAANYLIQLFSDGEHYFRDHILFASEAPRKKRHRRSKEQPPE